MGDLRDQLLKAGLVTDKQVKKADQAHRRAKKAKGHKALARERAQRQAALAAEQRQRAERDRAAAQARAAAEVPRERRAQVAQLIASHAIARATRGGRRWYYEALDGRVPYVTLSDEAAEGLEGGRFALVQGARGPAVLPRDAAERAAAIDPGCVLFLKARG